MFCPKCRAEFREGFTYCMTCNTNLVDKLPEEKKKKPGVYPASFPPLGKDIVIKEEFETESPVKELITNMSEDELVEALEDKDSAFTPEALKIARQELKKRTISKKKPDVPANNDKNKVVPNYFLISLILFFVTLFFGILAVIPGKVALFFSICTAYKTQANNDTDARKFSNNARFWCLIVLLIINVTLALLDLRNGYYRFYGF